MLGRLKHEGANIAVTPDGHVVAYMGDDQVNEYLYKFVSRDTFRPGSSRAAREHNMGLLEHGTLYVARFSGEQPQSCDPEVSREHDGGGDWIPLTSDTQSYVAGMSVADVLIDTRIAGDRAGATKMDRPEDVQPSPVNGKIYAALTKSPVRGVSVPVDAANPVGSSLIKDSLGAPPRQVAGNRNGYVLEMSEGEGHGAALTFGGDSCSCGPPGGLRVVLRRLPQGGGQPDQLPRQRRVRPRGQPVVVHGRQRAGIQRRHLPGAGQWAGTRVRQAVPHRPARCGGLRAPRQRGRSHGVDDGAAPGGRRDLRGAHQHLAAHGPLRAPLGRRDLREVSPRSAPNRAEG